MKKNYINTGLLFLSMLMVLISVTNEAAHSASPKEFYKGKVITFVVPYKTGGGYDTWSRMIAPGIKTYTGANIVIKNVPGAGSLLGANKIYVSKPNGLTIGILNTPSATQSQLTGLKGVKFDVLKYTWLGRLTAEQRVICVGQKSGYKTIDSLRQSRKPVKFGCSGIGSPTFFDISLVGHALDINTEIITGYGGSSETRLAVLRGELHAVVSDFSSQYPLIKSKDLIPVTHYGNVKMAELEGIPNVKDVLGIDEDKQQLLDIVVVFASLGRTVVAPPGLAPERAAFLTKAIKTSMEDPEFIKNARKRKMEIKYLPPAAVKELINKGLKISPELQNRVKKIMGR